MSGSPTSRAGFFSGPEPRLFGHRGASSRAPENTLESFRLALAAGAPYLELDVHLTADNHLAVIHDHSVVRTTGRRGQVETMSLAALRQLDPGYTFSPDRGRTFPYRGRGLTIATLDEVLATFPKALVTVEIKRSREGIERAVVEAIRRQGASSRVLVASAEKDILERFRTLDGGTPTSFSRSEVRGFLARIRERNLSGYTPPAEALQVPEFYGLRRVVSPALIEAAHRLGLEVHVWTVNEPGDIKRLLALGADGIMTDDPATALAAVEERGEAARTAPSRGGGNAVF